MLPVYLGRSPLTVFLNGPLPHPGGDHGSSSSYNFIAPDEPLGYPTVLFQHWWFGGQGYLRVLHQLTPDFNPLVSFAAVSVQPRLLSLLCNVCMTHPCSCPIPSIPDRHTWWLSSIHMDLFQLFQDAEKLFPVLGKLAIGFLNVPFCSGTFIS